MWNWINLTFDFIKKYFEWMIPILIILIIFIRVKIRKFFWLTRNGDELSFKEFLTYWKNGIEGTTPLQQTKIILWCMIPIIAGIIMGIVVSSFSKMWWIVLILIGSLPITLIQLLATWQKYKIQKKVDETMKELENQEEQGEQNEEQK